MTTVLFILALLLVPGAVQAQDDFESGLVDAPMSGDPVAAVKAPEVHRPQLVTIDTTTPKVIGASAAIVGGLSLVGAWAVYVARQNYRLRPWRDLSPQTERSWETQGAWSFGLAAGGAALLVTSEYLLLPESLDVPTLAWMSGAVGLGVAAVGIGFAVGGTHCGIEPAVPGANLTQGCFSGTSDSLFGSMLILSSVPLINIPIVFLLRKAFSGPPDSLSFGPGGVTVKGRF